jgi:hypothetical protein
MKKNVASQSVSAQVNSATDGSPFTGSVTVSVTGDNGTRATGSVGSGACTHEGGGLHSYAPAQAETNYDYVVFQFAGTGAITSAIHIYTSFPQTGDNFARLGAPAGASVSADIAAVKTQTAAIETDTAEIGTAGAGLTNINLPNQTMDIVGSITGDLTGSVGSIAAGGIAAASFAAGAVDAAALSADAGTELADALLNRNMATGTDSGSDTVRTVRQALRILRNMVDLQTTPGTMDVKKEDDSTSSWTAVLTTDAAAEPIVKTNPAGP